MHAIERRSWVQEGPPKNGRGQRQGFGILLEKGFKVQGGDGELSFS